MHASDSIYKRMSGQPLYKENMDTELDHKGKRVSDKFSETINMIANEPSLAFFRIQEHVRKTLPQLVDTKHEVEDVQARVQGVCFDTDYAVNAVKAMQGSAIHFQNIQDLLKNAMFMKQQISYEDQRRKQGRSSPMRGERRIPPTSIDNIPQTSGGGMLRPPASGIVTVQDSREEDDKQTTTNYLEKTNVIAEDNAENKEVEDLMFKGDSKTNR